MIARKVKIGAVLLGMVMFGAYAVASASAAPELLLAGAKLGASQEIPMEITGELLFEDMGATGEPAILCSYILDIHTVGGTLFFITELLMLNKEGLTETGVVGTPGTMIDCVGEKLCSTEEINLVTVLNLPWHVEVVLNMSGTTDAYLAVLLAETGHIPTYDIQCHVPIIGTVEDSCSGETSARLINGTGGLEGFFNSLAITETDGAASQPLNCTVGGTGQGLLESENGGGKITSTSGALTVSE